VSNELKKAVDPRRNFEASIPASLEIRRSTSSCFVISSEKSGLRSALGLRLQLLQELRDRLRALLRERLHLRVSDDGGGIDVAVVRKQALATGLLDPAVASTTSEQEILRTIFAAGFSTREQVSEVSGRGIGLNIVLDVVENVGGKVDVHSELGRGTTFDIEVPITVAITRVVLFRVGMGSYALPAASVRSLVLSSTIEHGDGPDGPSIQFAGAAVPVLDLGKVLDEARTPGENARIVIAQSGADLVALTGTMGHLEREVMLKPMGKFFEKLSLVAAAVNLEEGALALVLKAAELVLLSRLRSKRVASAADLEVRQAAGRVALVADDSPVVRDIVAQDKAGERIVEECVRRRNRHTAGGVVKVYKNNTDFRGHSYGCHENYLVDRTVNFHKLAELLIPFLVTRQIFTGAGRKSAGAPPNDLVWWWGYHGYFQLLTKLGQNWESRLKAGGYMMRRYSVEGEAYNTAVDWNNGLLSIQSRQDNYNQQYFSMVEDIQGNYDFGTLFKQIDSFGVFRGERDMVFAVGHHLKVQDLLKSKIF